MKTHCMHGHVSTKENIFINSRGHKGCRVCSNIALKKYKTTYPWKRHFSRAKARCQNKNTTNYCRYGGRGIKFLMTKEDFKFLWFRDKAYNMKKPSTDRIDNDGNYELSNCRFIEQSENGKLGAIYKVKNKLCQTKLTEDQVRQIRILFKKGISRPVLGKQFGVARATIGEIVSRKIWKQVL